MKLLIPILFIVLLACNNKAENKTETKDTTASQAEVREPVYNRSLLGKWRPVEVDMPGMADTRKQELIDSAHYEFTSAGQVIITMKDDRRTGTYMYSEQDSKLISQIGNKEEKFSISWDKELLKMTDENGTVVLKRQ